MTVTRRPDRTKAASRLAARRDLWQMIIQDWRLPIRAMQACQMLELRYPRTTDALGWWYAYNEWEGRHPGDIAWMLAEAVSGDQDEQIEWLYRLLLPGVIAARKGQ